MKTSQINKTLLILLINFSFFCLPKLSAQCTLQVFPNLINDDCQNASVGSVAAVGIFGTPPYTAVWRNSMGTIVDTDTNLLQGQASNASSLPADNYTVTFTDATLSCIIIANISIGNITIDTSTTLNNATISSNATGVIYQWLDCNNGMAPISGENNSTFTATSNGNYAVSLTKNTCTDVSACVSIATLSTDKITFANSFKVFPNPTNGIINIQASKTVKSVKLLDISGRQVLQTSAINTINIQDLNPGVYLVEILGNNNQKAIKKIIKQ